MEHSTGLSALFVVILGICPQRNCAIVGSMKNHASTIPPLIIASLVLAACGQTNEEAGPGGVSAGEAEALDDAAEIIEARRLPVEAFPENTANNGAPLPPERPAEEAPEQDGEASQ